jgi:penicillin-binding protein 2
VRNAMIDVNRFGTGRIAFANAGYTVAGKTGTAQVIGIKQNERYDASKIAQQYRDHSLFMAFAPAENPKIALAIIVENGGFGAQAAAPIARAAFDYYLLGKLPAGFAKPSPAASEDDLRDMPDNTEGEPDTPTPTPLGAPSADPAAALPSSNKPLAPTAPANDSTKKTAR